MEKINLSSDITLKGHFKATLRDDLTGHVLQVIEKDNIVVNVCKYGFAKLLNGETGFTGKFNYLAVGTGANTPSVSDTQLQTELARTTIVGGTNSRVNNVVSAEFYFAPTEANGAIKEVGVFIDGNAAANSGVLLDRTLLDITKTATNSLTLTFTVSVL